MTKLRILVADGDRKRREHSREIAKALHPGAEVHETADGIAAFNEASRGQLDLAIIDVNLPRRNGITLLQIFDGMPWRLLPRHVILVCDNPLQALGLRELARVQFDVVLRKEAGAGLRGRVRRPAVGLVNRWFDRR